MKRLGLSCATVCTFLLAATPTLAVIQANLENPASVQAVNGIITISGWAFSTVPSTDVTVKLRINGLTLDLLIPCCGPRQDVVDAHGAGTPLNSGFGLLFNYGLLSPGPHTIGVEIGAPGEDTKFIDHSVTEVKPGNAELLSSFTLPASANCSISGNEIVITGAQITPSGGTATATDLRAQFQLNSQSLGFTAVSGVPEPTTFTANLNGSQETPPVDTEASGTGSLTLNPDNTITCSILTTGITGTLAHIHLAAAGVAGGFIVSLIKGPGEAWSCPSSPAATLTAEQVTALQEARLYFDVHSVAHSDGEIRGQIVATGS